jgi:hypothetical protein
MVAVMFHELYRPLLKREDPFRILRSVCVGIAPLVMGLIHGFEALLSRPRSMRAIEMPLAEVAGRVAGGLQCVSYCDMIPRKAAAIRDRDEARCVLRSATGGLQRIDIGGVASNCRKASRTGWEGTYRPQRKHLEHTMPEVASLGKRTIKMALRKNKWVAICVRLAPEIGFSRHDRAKRMVLLAYDFKVQTQNLGKI